MSARRAGALSAARLAVAAAFAARYAAAHESPTIALRIDVAEDGRVVLRQLAGPKALVAVTPPPRCARIDDTGARTQDRGFSRAIETATGLPATLRCAPGWARDPFTFSGLGAHAQAVTVRVAGAYSTTRTVYAHAPVLRVADDGDARDPSASDWVASRIAPPLVAGAAHVARGLDHLAIVALLAAAASGLAELVLPLLGFTLAHALTLGFAAFGHPLVEPRLAELLVAATLVLGTELAPGDRLAARAGAAFAFGLVHGVAFLEGAAPLLAQSEAPIVTLASFHVGIEAVQLAVALALAGLFRAASRRWPGAVPLRRMLALAAGSYGFALFLARLA